MADYRQDVIDFRDGFKCGYEDGTYKAVRRVQDLLDEVIYDLGYDKDTRWEIVSNLYVKIKQTDFLDRLDKEVWNYIQSRG